MKLNHCFRNFFLFLIHDLYTCLIASKLDTNHSFVGSGRLGKMKSHFWYSGWLKLSICKYPRIIEIWRKMFTYFFLNVFTFTVFRCLNEYIAILLTAMSIMRNDSVSIRLCKSFSKNNQLNGVLSISVISYLCMRWDT